jgi:hypothetical protein
MTDPSELVRARNLSELVNEINKKEVTTEDNDFDEIEEFLIGECGLTELED